jgi:hypothetical protein
MDAKQIIRGLKDWVKREKGIDLQLNACQEAILEYSLQNIVYSNMDNLGYAVDTIKNNTGPDLFKYLSQITDRKVSKKNCWLTLPRLLECPASEENTGKDLLRIDLLEAGVSKDFYGREEELSKLETWIVKEHCPLVGVFGMGGIGKTPLLRSFVDKVKDKFDYVIWKNLKYSPLLEDFLTHIESYFPIDNSQTSLNKQNISQRIKNLIYFLNQHRCLLIFDQWEQLMITDEISENQQKINNSNYGKLVKAIEELEHQSCLVLISLQTPKQMNLFVNNSRVRELSLSGLNNQDSEYLLKRFNLSKQGLENLIKQYKGHPLALEFAAQHIQDNYNGQINEFLKGTLFIDNNITDLFDKQFSYLSNIEINIMRKLAYEIEAMSLPDIYQLFPAISPGKISQAIDKLCTVGLIKKKDSQKLPTFCVVHYLLTKYVKNRYREI